ncbi:MAG TPA: ATP-binding protein, partial [Solirubrobacteraceae bacterium]
LAKTTVATERDVQLVLSEDSQLAGTDMRTNMLLSIVGNLIDNAIDAAAAGPRPASVTMRLTNSDEVITIEVSDSGRGVPEELSTRIFTDGFTTKSPAGDRHRGIGLALVHRLATRAGGTIAVDCSGPTTFTVVLPITQQPESQGAEGSGEAAGGAGGGPAGVEVGA